MIELGPTGLPGVMAWLMLAGGALCIGGALRLRKDGKSWLGIMIASVAFAALGLLRVFGVSHPPLTWAMVGLIWVGGVLGWRDVRRDRLAARAARKKR